MSRRPLAQRPLKKLAKLELPREPAAEPAAPSFAEAMQREGTVPLEADHKRVLPPSPSAALRGELPPASAPAFRVEQDEGWIEGYREGLSVRERSRVHGVAVAALDLHGHHVQSARRALAEFLTNEHKLGRERVLVIVGKGLHAPNGTGVLRENIAEWLSQPPLASRVLAFCTAPREQGGSGAVVVLLARRRKNDKD